ncbi:MAG TPA: hypothetical protein VGG57_21105 [Stellaceae bacterium]
MKSWFSLGVGILVLAAVVILFGTQAIAYVKAGYPPDSIQREVLDHCAAADSHFLRFSVKDRAECYKSAHLNDIGVMR